MHSNPQQRPSTVKATLPYRNFFIGYSFYLSFFLTSGFKIVSEAGIASGVRRIEAVAGPAMIEYLTARDGVVKQLSTQFRVRDSVLHFKFSERIVLALVFHLGLTGYLSEVL